MARSLSSPSPWCGPPIVLWSLVSQGCGPLIIQLGPSSAMGRLLRPWEAGFSSGEEPSSPTGLCSQGLLDMPWGWGWGEAFPMWWKRTWCVSHPVCLSPLSSSVYCSRGYFPFCLWYDKCPQFYVH
jgi:hypothetical protein